ncbi:hypothetical protein C0Q70_08777 [Pomacea canaliculata]|uniref:Poly [ADP-ribose] polymerase n=1 Tax=Pomacea canaliculata TaxID=400727 RepID=A0A2T7P805_POMCA|nr:hypothetical protein C0Q70_08777 [Pomacea canaliculata]
MNSVPVSVTTDNVTTIAETPTKLQASDNSGKKQGQKMSMHAYSKRSKKTLTKEIGWKRIPQKAQTLSDNDEEPTTDTIKIRGVTNALTAAKCKYFFQNPDKGGGPIEESKWDNGEQILYIKFKDAKVARRAASSLHVIDGGDVEVSLAPRGIPGPVGMRTVGISGCDLEFKGMYILYFENPINGGGAINSVSVDKHHDKLFITFEDAAVAETVCSRRHKVEDRELEVRLASLEQTTNVTRLLDQDFDDCLKTLEVTNGQHLKTEDEYLSYFQHCGHKYGGKVEDFALDKENGKLLVTFDTTEDVQRIKDKCSRKTLDGRHPQVCRVPVSNCILVENLSPVTTDDEVAQYFESPRANGSTVLRVKRTTANSNCLVFFEDSKEEVFQQICSMNQAIQSDVDRKEREVVQSEALQKFELDLLQLLPLFTQDEQPGGLVVDIRPQKGEIYFRGLQEEILEVQVKMFRALRETASQKVESLEESKCQILSSEESRDAIGKDLQAAGLKATWEHTDKGVITVYCLNKSELPQAVHIIDTSVIDDVLHLNELSLVVLTTHGWKSLEASLLKKNHGVLRIQTDDNSIHITSLQKIMPTVKRRLIEFISEHTMISTNEPGEHEVVVGGNHTVSAVAEDITTLEVDAIVNAANENMQHIGGVAKRIVSRGGQEIQSECYNILKARGKLSEGDVLVSGPGKLPCKSIIHAVGPRYKGGNKGEEQCLQATVLQCLKTASDLDYTSIALPAISSGVFGYPVEEATRVIVEAVQLFFDTNPNSSIRNVLLCDILQNTVKSFQLALTMASYHKVPTTATRDAELKSIQRIAMQEVDVIVNSAAASLSLNKGAISSSIATAAGPDLQKECHLKYPKGIAEGDMASAGVSVEMCLKEASIHQFSTIAIPALGTGNLGFPRDVVARTMLTTVSRFPQKFPNTSLKEVRVVLFKDPETMQAFRTEQKRMAGEEIENILPQKIETSIPDAFCGDQSDEDTTDCSEDEVWDSLETAPPKGSEKSKVAARKQPIPEAVTLYIYAADSKRVANIMKEFTIFVNGKFITKSVEHMNKLSDEELKGMREDVDMATREIFRIQNMAEQKKQETLTANLVQWYYIKETSTGVERKSFDKSDNMVIEHAYQSKKTSVYLYRGSTFEVDFTEMEVNPRDNPENKLKVMRKEIIEDIASSMSMLPETWELHAKSETTKLVTLNKSSPEYISVCDGMLRTSGGPIHVLQIQRVQNPELYQQYMAKKARMSKDNRAVELERTLWHGTSGDNTRNINLYGFNRSYCGKNEADRESPAHDSIMYAFQSIFRYFRGYWSQGTPQDEKMLVRISKEMLMNFLKIVTGQEDIETLYCDRPGDVLVTFKTEVAGSLEVSVSNSILVENLRQNTDLELVSCYFETQRAKGGPVLKVQPVKDQQTCVVCFEDASVVDEVLKVPHRLGGRELRVSLYVECLGPSGGRTEPHIFVCSPPVELTDENNLKVAFLRHNSEMLQMFNLYLSKVHANATVVGNVLIPEIWWDVRNTISQSELNTDDLVLSHDEEYTFSVLDRSFDEGGTFAHIQNIASVKQKKSLKPKVFDSEKLKKFQLDLLMLSTFISDTQSHHKDLKVDIKLENREVVFNGPLLMVRKARLRMYEILQSASSTVVTDVPHVHVSLLATDEARDAVNNRLRQAGLAATWECCGNVVVVYSLHQTALPLAVNVIKTSFKSERIVLDKSSSSLHTTAEWKDNVEKLLKKHLGLLKISTDHRTILVTAFCDIMSTVKENINKCALESSMSSAAFQLSPSRLKFVTLFWEEKVSSIAVKLKGYKINITLQSDRVLVGGTKQGIELVRKELNSLSEQIICTEELIIRKETIRCLSTLRNNNELQAIAFTCKCVLSLHPENVSVEMSATNLPAEGPRVHAVQGDITQLPVDVIVNAANELMDRAGGFAGGIALKGNVLVSGPGKLPCKAIIHAGGPRYKGGNKGEEECLRDTVMECLKTASDRRYTSIAIPAISSGIFGYPVKEATRVIVQAVKLFFETNRDSSITDVQLADIRIDTVQEFQKALKAIYSNYTPITKQGLSGKEQSPTIGTISAIQGDITQMTVDVIVNAANERMTHDNGLAGYIVRKGGDTIQEECYRILRTRGKLSEGDVLVSGPGKLPFKAIIHAVGPAYRGGTRGEEECLRGTVLKCLMTASHQGYTSIAIPAISTGSLRYPAEEATRVIVQAVRVFFDTSPKSSIKDVRLCDISRSTVEDFKGAIQAASEEMDLSSASSQATSQTEMSSPSRWFRLSPRMTQPRNTFSSEKGVDKGTRKPKALSPPETLKLYIFTADPQRKEHFLKALDEFVDSKFVEQEIEDFDQISPDMLEDACKKYNVELLLWDSGATVGGMSEDVQKLKEEISSMIKTAERQQQESMIANLVQWYYFDIERIQNGDLYRQYVAKKAQIDRQNNGMSSEKTLWHGTSLQAIDNINLYGFNRSFCGRNATAYGQGVYFAVNSSYSMSDTYSVRDQSGNKHMYQCKVLVGCPTVGNSDMKFLPTRRGKIRYDSATDSTSQPSQYVIFNDTQAYPEYLITFQYIWGEGYMP